MEKITRSRSPIISRFSCSRYIRLVKHPERQGTDCPVLLHKDLVSLHLHSPHTGRPSSRGPNGARLTYDVRVAIKAHEGGAGRASPSDPPRKVVDASCISWFADPITGGFLRAAAVTHSLALGYASPGKSSPREWRLKILHKFYSAYWLTTWDTKDGPSMV